MSFVCSNLSIIRAHVWMFLQLNNASLIFCFSSVPTSFVSAMFCVVGGLDRLKKGWFWVLLSNISDLALCSWFTVWWASCCLCAVCNRGTLQPRVCWCVTNDGATSLTRCCCCIIGVDGTLRTGACWCIERTGGMLRGRDDSLRWFPSINGCPVKEDDSDSMSLILYSVLSRPVLFGTLAFSAFWCWFSGLQLFIGSSFMLSLSISWNTRFVNLVCRLMILVFICCFILLYILLSVSVLISHRTFPASFSFWVCKYLFESIFPFSSLAVCSSSKFLSSSCWHLVPSSIFSLLSSCIDFSLILSCYSTFLHFASLALSAHSLTSFRLSGWFCSLCDDFLGFWTGLFSRLFLGLVIGLFALEFIGDSAFASVFSCGSFVPSYYVSSNSPVLHDRQVWSPFSSTEHRLWQRLPHTEHTSYLELLVVPLQIIQVCVDSVMVYFSSVSSDLPIAVSSSSSCCACVSSRQTVFFCYC